MNLPLRYRTSLLNVSLLLMFFTGCRADFKESAETESPIQKDVSNLYYIDSENGNDEKEGHRPETAWKSLARIEKAKFSPGDKICFKRGSTFRGKLEINDSGNAKNYIILSDYGSEQEAAPSFTNTDFNPDKNEFGNCIRLKGSFIIVENLYFHNTVAELPGTTGSFLTMWELGAVYLDKTSQNCIVRNNEIFNCGVGIKSYGRDILIQNNYIHDCNRILKEWNWGPIGIWLGADNQEVCYNTIINYSAVDPRITWGPDAYGGGADGGAIEIDDARIDKQNISIHHNYSRDCQGFMEVTWADVEQKPDYRDFSIHHNISDDFQQFIALWRGADCKIDNNTIIRRKRNANDWGVFNITQYNSRNLIRNNIIVTEEDIVIFNLGKNSTAQPQNIIENNLYFAASGSLKMGKEGPGNAAVFANPEFENYLRTDSPEAFSLRKQSPAIDKGTDAGYEFSYDSIPIPQGIAADIGAFEFKQD